MQKNKLLSPLAATFGCALLLLLAGSSAALAAGGIPRADGFDLRVRPLHAPQTALEPTPSSIYSPAPAFKPGAIIVRHKGLSAGDAPSLDEQAQNALDDYETSPAQSVADPLEPWNRFWFHFNDIFFIYIAKPAYTAWEFITPRQIRSGLKNFFHNVLFPMRFINNILQFRFMEAGVEFGRFFINTTTTLGFSDITKDKKTIVPVDPSGEDFGQTLGRWGIGHGIYLVWPFIGPSSLRESVGRLGDCFTDPIFYLQPWWAASGTEVGFRFNDLDGVLPLYDDMKMGAVDPYISMREAYINFRAVQVAR